MSNTLIRVLTGVGTAGTFLGTLGIARAIGMTPQEYTLAFLHAGLFAAQVELARATIGMIRQLREGDNTSRCS